MKNAHGEKGRVYGEKPHNPNISGARPALPRVWVAVVTVAPTVN